MSRFVIDWRIANPLSIRCGLQIRNEHGEQTNKEDENMIRMIFRLFILLFLIIGLAFLCKGLLPHPHTAELRTAYERSCVAEKKAQITFDPSYLSEGFTQHAVATITPMLQQDAGTTFIGSEEKIIYLSVVEYNPPEAIIEVKYSYRGYTYNRSTKVITYDNVLPDRYWRIDRYRMKQENGIWKFDETVEFVGWSG